MILLFLGSWRSTLIVLISIPLSILTSIVVLYFVGDTLNTMTLGGRRSRSASWSTIRR
jgi:multidrug efflux pump subunit AcrB